MGRERETVNGKRKTTIAPSSFPDSRFPIRVSRLESLGPIPAYIVNVEELTDVG